jgi:ABC-type bacteriocin/lantibiotic exporter with double-glycine peptidase domain
MHTHNQHSGATNAAWFSVPLIPPRYTSTATAPSSWVSDYVGGDIYLSYILYTCMYLCVVWCVSVCLCVCVLIFIFIYVSDKTKTTCSHNQKKTRTLAATSRPINHKPTKTTTTTTTGCFDDAVLLPASISSSSSSTTATSTTTSSKGSSSRERAAESASGERAMGHT